MKKSFLLKKSVIASIGIIGLIAGFIFINLGGAVNILNGQVTGNFVLNTFSAFSIVSLIGILLILFSSVLIAYSIIKK